MAQFALLLAEGPLYRTYEYKGNLWQHHSHPGTRDIPSRTFYEFTFAPTIQLYCEACRLRSIWKLEDVSQPLNYETKIKSIVRLGFMCRNCGNSRVEYYVLIEADATKGKITKIGQWPPFSREADPAVTSGWSKADKALYRDAMTLRHSNKGIGALPYLRRIIENHIKDVLTLIRQAHERNPIDSFDESTYASAEASHRFKVKLDFAKAYLPNGLTPKGSPNPIDILYALISDGLHERTEEECVDIFDRCKTAFEYVVKKLSDAKREDEVYAQEVRKLAVPPKAD